MAHEITSVGGEHSDLLKKIFYDDVHAEGFIRVDGTLVPNCYRHYIDSIENFEVRDDDIWLCSFPKTGTTWTQEMVWCIANDLDFEGAKETLTTRFPFLEICAVTDYVAFEKQNPEITLPEHGKNSISFVEKLPSPRFIKSHLPFNLLPRQLRTGEKKPKIIYPVRNVKDTCISYYYHSIQFENIAEDFDGFCTLFLNDTVLYAPFWKHVLSFWERRMDENLLILRFEDMKKDLPLVIQKTATFLGKHLTTDHLSILTEHLRFDSMKVNPATNNEDLLEEAPANAVTGVKGKFMRSGEVGQWKTHMSIELIDQFESWTVDSLKGTDYRL